MGLLQKFGLSPQEADKQWQAYFQARLEVEKSDPRAWSSADKEQKQRMIGEVILERSNPEDPLLGARLWYAGLTLEDLRPEGYNSQ